MDGPEDICGRIAFGLTKYHGELLQRTTSRVLTTPTVMFNLDTVYVFLVMVGRPSQAHSQIPFAIPYADLSDMPKTLLVCAAKCLAARLTLTGAVTGLIVLLATASCFQAGIPIEPSGFSTIHPNGPLLLATGVAAAGAEPPWVVFSAFAEGTGAFAVVCGPDT